MSVRNRRPAMEGQDFRPTMVQPVTGIASATTAESSRFNSRIAAKAVVTFVLISWLASVVFGAALHRDVLTASNKALKQSLPLSWYDGILRRYGAALPFPAFAVRWWGTALSAPGPDVRPASHFAEAFCIYIGLTLARVVLYGFHVTGILHWLCRGLLASVPEHKGAHIMSDHLVLGASIVAICMAEVVLGWIDLRRLIASCKPEGFRLLCLATGLLLSGLLSVATIGDMFYTARYFHGRLETLGGVLVGAIFFQGPLAYWLLS